MNEMMIDIETLDVERTAVVLQVGVAVFNDDGILDTFERNLEVQPQINSGRTISWNTLKFWMRQPDAARESVIRKEVDEYDALPAALHHKIYSVAKEYSVKRFWTKGSFDFEILEDLWGPAVPPWEFWEKRDLRTALDFSKAAKELERGEGSIGHTGLADAVHQIHQLALVRLEAGGSPAPDKRD